MVAGRGIVRNYGRNNNSPATGWWLVTPSLVQVVGRIIPSPVLSRANCNACRQAKQKWQSTERGLQIRFQRPSRNASSFGDGRHLFEVTGTSPARFQKASRTSRFICRLVVI